MFLFSSARPNDTLFQSLALSACILCNVYCYYYLHLHFFPSRHTYHCLYAIKRRLHGLIVEAAFFTPSVPLLWFFFLTRNIEKCGSWAFFLLVIIIARWYTRCDYHLIEILFCVTWGFFVAAWIFVESIDCSVNVIRFREIVGFDQQGTFGDVTSNEELNTLLSILFFAKVDFFPHVIMVVFLLSSIQKLLAVKWITIKSINFSPNRIDSKLWLHYKNSVDNSVYCC